jgi:hypothetical protein
MTAADNAAAFYRFCVNAIADANANLEGMFSNTQEFQRANNQTLRRVENDYMAKIAAAKTAVAEEAAAIAAYRNEINARMAGGAEGSRLRTAASDSRDCAATAAQNAARYRAAAAKAAAVEPDTSTVPKE